MKRKIIFTGAFLSVFLLGWLLAANKGEQQMERLVAVSWGDGKYGKAFYGAYVFLRPVTGGGYYVMARVQIGRGNPMFHDCDALGYVADPKEAVAKWGKIDWQEDGLHIGTGTNAYFLPRAKLESHR